MARYRYSKKTSGIAGFITAAIIIALLVVLAWTNWATVWNWMGHVDHWACNTFGMEVHHQYAEDAREDATCDGEGFVVNRCGVCGDEHLEVLEATGHTPDEETVVVVPSTETETGTKTYVCLDCGETVVETLPLIVHTPETQDDGVEATCTTDGMTASVVCADCGEVIEGQEEIPALGHDLVDGVCTRCNVANEAAYFVVEESDHYSFFADTIEFYGTGESRIVSTDTYSDLVLSITIADNTDVRGAFQIAFGASDASAEVSTLPYLQFNYDQVVLVLPDGTTENFWDSRTVKNYSIVLNSSGLLKVSTIYSVADYPDLDASERVQTLFEVSLTPTEGYIVMRAEALCATTVTIDNFTSSTHVNG